MGRDSKPWYRKDKKAWYVKLGGKSRRLHADKGEALKAWHGLLAPGEGMPTPIVVRSVRSVIDAYMRHVEITQKPASLECKRKTLLLLRKDKGTDEASKLDAPGVVEWIATHSGWGQGRRWLAGNIVSACWRWSGMPLGKLGLPAPRSRGSSSLMDEESHRRLMDSAPECYRNALRFLRGTGCRPGEMCQLEARHISAGEGSALLEMHKTDKGGLPRLLVLAGDAREVVRSLVEAHPSGPLFCDTKGQRLTPDRLRNWMFKRARSLGLRGAMPYGYRHAYATDALEKGIPDAHVAALLGHSVAVLHKHYSHLTSRMGALREAAERVAEPTRG